MTRCPVCGADSETSYRCDECGRDLADVDDDDDPDAAAVLADGGQDVQSVSGRAQIRAAQAQSGKWHVLGPRGCLSVSTDRIHSETVDQIAADKRRREWCSYCERELDLIRVEQEVGRLQERLDGPPAQVWVASGTSPGPKTIHTADTCSQLDPGANGTTGIRQADPTVYPEREPCPVCCDGGSGWTVVACVDCDNRLDVHESLLDTLHLLTCSYCGGAFEPAGGSD